MAGETLTGVFSDIADAVRAKGVTGQMTPLQMPQKIADIPSGGSGDPLYEVDEQGVVHKTTGVNVNWFNDLTTIPVDGLKSAYKDRTQIVSASFPNLTTILTSGMTDCFSGCSNLSSVYLPKVEYLSGSYYQLSHAFAKTALTSIEFPLLQNARSLYGSDLGYICSTCTSLVSASFPELTTLGNSGMEYAFEKCTNLKQVYLPKLSSTYSNSLNYCFQNCTSLELVDFHLATSIPTIGTTTFYNTNNTFKIVVPNDLYSQWKTATNWSTYADQIVMANPGVLFEATQANSTIKLTQVGNPTPVSLEYMTTGSWTPYTIGDTITLANVGDSVLFRAASGANNKFGTDASNYHQFVMTGEIEANNSINFLLNQNGTDSTLADNSYLFYKMFSDCSALTKAPELPSTTLANFGYYGLFYNCSSLTTAPDLPATTLAGHCYEAMFLGCSSLTTAPSTLPAATLAPYCYSNMFEGCTSLTTAPELMATTLANGCYTAMFFGCSNLNTITLYYTGNFASAPTDAFDGWVYNVGSNGTFYYDGSDTTRGTSAIPSSWTVLSIPKPELCFTAREANSTVKMMSSSGPSVSLEYSTDYYTWSPFVVGTTTVTLANIDDKMWLRATSTNSAMASSYNSSYNYFVMTGQIAASGNINSLLNGLDPDAVTTAPQYAYPCLFQDCSALVDATDLILPSTTASQNSYGHGMFRNCTNLVGGPTIMATNLVSGTWIAEYMFYNCSSLTSVKIYATGSSWSSSCTDNWMYGVPSTGTFYYNGTYTGRSASEIPTGWTITPFT